MSSADAISRRIWLLAAPCAALATLTSCARFRVPEETAANRVLPSARMSPDSVILEIGYAQLPLADKAPYDEVWQLADEQALAIELRQELSRNGLRCGILGKRLPEKIRALLNQKVDTGAARADDINAGDVEVDRQTRRVQCRTGRRTKILCSKQFPELSLLTYDGGSVRGQMLEKAQCLFSLKSYPEGDGRVRLDLLPEVEHGEFRQHWVSGEGTLMQRSGRDKLALEQLRMSLTLAPGQMLVVSAGEQPKGLGEHFFVESIGGTPSRSLILIRLAHTQHDTLFAPDLTPPPLATPGE